MIEFFEPIECVEVVPMKIVAPLKPRKNLDLSAFRQTPVVTTLYELRCNLQTPDGRNPCIRTIWEIIGNAPPNFITAYANP